MSTINDADLLAVERSGTLYQVRSDELSTLNDTDLLAVERSGTLYKIEAQDLELGPTGTISTPVEVLTPTNGSGLNDGQPYNPLTSAITTVGGGGTLTTLNTSAISTVTYEPNWVNSITQGYTPWNGRVFDSDNETDVINGGASHGARQSDKCGDNSVNACHIMSFDFTIVQSSGLSVSSALEVYTFENRSAAPNYETLHYRVNGGSWQLATLGGNGWLTVATSGTVNTLDLRHKEYQYTSNRPSVWGFRLDGNIISGVGRPIVTVADNTNLGNLSTGDTLRQEPGTYTPQSPTISSFTSGESGWDDISSLLSFPITITQIGWNTGSGSDGCSLVAIEIDGTVLDDTGNRSGNTTYSGTYYGGTTANIFDGNYYPGNQTSLGGRPNPFYINFGSGVIPTAQSKVRLLWGTESGNWQINGTTIRNGYAFYTVATPFQTLTFSSNTGLENFQANDNVQKVGDSSKTGTVASVDKSNSQIVVNNSSFAAGDSIQGPAFQSTNTINNISGNSIKMNGGRWFADSNLTLGKRENYNRTLTFADSTNVDKIIGTAYQAESDGTNATSISTNNITSIAQNPETNWVDLSSVISYPFTLTEMNFYGGNSGAWCYYTAIEVDGTVLDNTGNRSGNTTVTNAQHIWTGSAASIFDGNYLCGSSTSFGARMGGFRLQFGSGVIPQANSSLRILAASEGGGSFTINGSINARSLITQNTGCANASTTALTTNGNTNFDLFATNDVVQYTGNREATWSSGLSSPTGWINSQRNETVPFDPNNGYEAVSNGTGTTITWTSPVVFPSNSTIEIIATVASQNTLVSINGGASQTIGASSNRSDWKSVTYTNYSSSQFVMTLQRQGGQQTELVGVRVNGVELHDPNTTDPNAIKVVSKDNATSTMTVTNGGTWVTGLPITKTFTPASITSVLSTSGSTLYGTGTGTFYPGKYLKGAQISFEAASPSSIVFTSSNAGTAAFNGTNATLASRLWTLESGSSSTGPWGTAATYTDTSANASQDGSTAWSGRPTLAENTYYRCKVAYTSDNAVTVESSPIIFRTGDA